MPTNLPAASAPPHSAVLRRADRPRLGMVLLMMALLFVGHYAFTLAMWCVDVTSDFHRRHS